MKRPWFLEYVTNRFSLLVRCSLSVIVLVLVIIFSLDGFVNGKNSWFVGTDGVIWDRPYAFVRDAWPRLSNCRPRVLPHAPHLGEMFEVDACEVNCVAGET